MRAEWNREREGAEWGQSSGSSSGEWANDPVIANSHPPAPQFYFTLKQQETDLNLLRKEKKKKKDSSSEGSNKGLENIKFTISSLRAVRWMGE